MKKIGLLAVLVGLFALSALAQDKAKDYSGTWTLDASKSKLDERSRIEAMTMTVAQTDKELKVTTETKRAARADSASGGMGRGGRGGDGTTTYSLDGKETKIQQETPMGAMPVTLKAKTESGGALKLSSARTFNGPQGEVTMTTNETWTLSADGKTLTVNREIQSPRGNVSSEMVFTKN